jgi:hypothetical protein
MSKAPTAEQQLTLLLATARLVQSHLRPDKDSDDLADIHEDRLDEALKPFEKTKLNIHEGRT